MAASGDFYGTNSQILSFDMPSGVVDGAEFCVPTGVPFEFYSSMSTMTQVNGAVSALQLVKASDPTTIIVESSQDEMLDTLDNRDHNYSINYKGVGDGSPFQVYYSAVQGAGQMGSSPIMGFQWGVKSYTDMYTFRQESVCM